MTIDTREGLSDLFRRGMREGSRLVVDAAHQGLRERGTYPTLPRPKARPVLVYVAPRAEERPS